MNLTPEEKQLMLQELLDAVDSSDDRDLFPQPNLTVAEYAEMKGMKKDTAYKRLERAVKAGRIKRSEKKLLIDGSWRPIYWKA